MIEYQFTLEDGAVHTFSVDTERVYDLEEDDADHPAWTDLGFHQCANCSLSFHTFRHCPVAVDIEDALDNFKAIASHEEAEVLVRTEQRDYVKRLDVKSALSSLLGLIMATSSCPTLAMLKTLASYHLPFATLEETLFRTVGAYLLKQYFIAREGGSPDLKLDGLYDLYQQLEVLNSYFEERIRGACEEDESMGIVNKLFALSMGVSFSLSTELEQLRSMFLIG